MDRVMVELCAELRTTPEAQMAVWMARDGITMEEYEETRRLRGAPYTFDGTRVLPEHVDLAAQVLREAGIDPVSSSSYRGRETHSARPAHLPIYVKPPSDSPAKGKDWR